AALTPHPFAVAVVCYSLPPRASTLFPYTTLFRSGGPCERRIGPLEEALPVGEDRGLAAQRRAAVDEDRLVVDEGGEGLEVALGQDRKSTRLNSSHVKISYAVVCLKKKTEGQTDRF